MHKKININGEKKKTQIYDNYRPIHLLLNYWFREFIEDKLKNEYKFTKSTDIWQIIYKKIFIQIPDKR